MECLPRLKYDSISAKPSSRIATASFGPFALAARAACCFPILSIAFRVVSTCRSVDSYLPSLRVSSSSARSNGCNRSTSGKPLTYSPKGLHSAVVSASSCFALRFRSFSTGSFRPFVGVTREALLSRTGGGHLLERRSGRGRAYLCAPRGEVLERCSYSPQSLALWQRDRRLLAWHPRFVFG